MGYYTLNTIHAVGSISRLHIVQYRFDQPENTISPSNITHNFGAGSDNYLNTNDSTISQTNRESSHQHHLSTMPRVYQHYLISTPYICSNSATSTIKSIQQYGYSQHANSYHSHSFNGRRTVCRDKGDPKNIYIHTLLYANYTTNRRHQLNKTTYATCLSKVNYDMPSK